MSDQLSYFIRLSSVLEAMPDALVIVDKDGRIVHINKQTEKLFGYERSELLGELVEQLMPVRYRDHHQGYRDGYFENPRVRSMGEGLELFGLTKSGDEFPVEISLSPLKTEEGTYTLSAIRDITIRKKAEAKFKSIVEAAPDCLLIINGDGNIVLANNLLEKIFGYSKNEVLGKSVEMLIPERYRGNHVGHRQHYFAKPRSRGMGEGMELYGLHKEGHEFPVEISLSPLDTEEGQLALAAVRNITERKKLEQELRIKNNELQIQNLRVQEATKLKSAFLANMSHELRTPLNGIIGFTELMHSEKVGPISAQHKEFLNDILTSSHHLLQLINDILDLSKIESGKMEFSPQQVETKKIIREVCDILRMLISKKNLQLNTIIDDELKNIYVDPSKLKQVLYNFLSNAIKFTPDNGLIEINITPENKDYFKISIKDTGIGIKESDLPKLFQEFQQLDSGTNKKYQGTGLGLALTKRIVEAQGGSVGVESEQGKGSHFYAILPKKIIIEENIFTGIASYSSKSNILVIEDDPQEAEFLFTTLTKEGYAVDIVATGEDALNKLNQKKYDAVTLDLLMPDMNGWQILKSLRSQGLNQDVSVIVITIVKEKEESFGFSISDFLVKPIKSQDLLDSIKRLGLDPSHEKTVLVIDDDHQSLKLAANILKKNKVNVICETDSRHGLVLAKKIKPSVIILDLLMPHMDGFEFLDELKKTEEGKNIPVIIWTMKDLAKKEREQLELSAEGIVAKHGGNLNALLDELKVHIQQENKG